MQDFTDQANKNGVVLLSKGKCQFCGAEYQKGIFECMENYNQGLKLLDFSDPGNHITRFYSVDAHALQHPEIHGRWSNHFHLTRLNLMLDKKVKWDYKKSPLLSNYINKYKLSRPNAFLVPPMPLQRGNITAKNLTSAATAEECIELVTMWAYEVYQAWKPNHVLVSEIAAGFIEVNPA